MLPIISTNPESETDSKTFYNFVFSSPSISPSPVPKQLKCLMNIIGTSTQMSFYIPESFFFLSFDLLRSFFPLSLFLRCCLFRVERPSYICHSHQIQICLAPYRSLHDGYVGFRGDTFVFFPLKPGHLCVFSVSPTPGSVLSTQSLHSSFFPVLHKANLIYKN